MVVLPVVKVIAAEVTVVLALLEHVVGDHLDRVFRPASTKRGRQPRWRPRPPWPSCLVGSETPQQEPEPKNTLFCFDLTLTLGLD